MYDFAQDLLNHFDPAEEEKPKTFRERVDWQLVQISIAVGVVLALTLTTVIAILIRNRP